MFARFSQIKEVNSSKKVYEDSQELINISVRKTERMWKNELIAT